jgi:hypothetical protein
LNAASTSSNGVGHRITGDRARRPSGVGWNFLHVCADDASRLAWTEVLAAERTAAMRLWLRRCNRHRPPSDLGEKPPCTRSSNHDLLGNGS